MLGDVDFTLFGKSCFWNFCVTGSVIFLDHLKTFSELYITSPLAWVCLWCDKIHFVKKYFLKIYFCCISGNSLFRFHQTWVFWWISALPALYFFSTISKHFQSPILHPYLPEYVYDVIKYFSRKYSFSKYVSPGFCQIRFSDFVKSASLVNSRNKAFPKM